NLPRGFTATVFADGLNTPRFIAFGPDGALYVAERGANAVVSFSTPGPTSAATRRLVVARDLEDPTSLPFGPDGSLYIGEQTRITRLNLAYDRHVLTHKTIISDMTSSGNHNTPSF